MFLFVFILNIYDGRLSREMDILMTVYQYDTACFECLVNYMPIASHNTIYSLFIKSYEDELILLSQLCINQRFFQALSQGISCFDCTHRNAPKLISRKTYTCASPHLSRQPTKNEAHLTWWKLTPLFYFV